MIPDVAGKVVRDHITEPFKNLHHIFVICLFLDEHLTIVNDALMNMGVQIFL